MMIIIQQKFKDFWLKASANEPLVRLIKDLSLAVYQFKNQDKRDMAVRASKENEIRERSAAKTKPREPE